MGMFGWSYPPGCSGPPDYSDYPCPICGKMENECQCEECPKCGTFGCLEHLPSSKLIALYDLISYQYSELKAEIARRDSKIPKIVCSDCGQEINQSILDDYPLYCCNKERDKNGKAYEPEW